MIHDRVKKLFIILVCLPSYAILLGGLSLFKHVRSIHLRLIEFLFHQNNNVIWCFVCFFFATNFDIKVLIVRLVF